MAINPYFYTSFYSKPQQNLLSSLMKEAIQQQGYDVYYMPREIVNLDYLFGEDVSSRFMNAIQIEAYIKTFEGHGGEQDVISKFGLDIRDEMVLQIHQGRFREEITSQYPNVVRPREGDLIFFGLDRGISIFEISYVENEIPFYQLGEQYLYDIKMKRFVYSGEHIETGNQDIDIIMNYGATTKLVLGLSPTSHITFSAGETAYQSTGTIQQSTASGIVISHIGDELVLNQVKGVFVQGINIRGETSLANWAYPIKDDTTHVDNESNKVNDNLEVKLETDIVVDRSEANPFVDF